jgi:hypothetical protein
MELSFTQVGCAGAVSCTFLPSIPRVVICAHFVGGGKRDRRPCALGYDDALTFEKQEEARDASLCEHVLQSATLVCVQVANQTHETVRSLLPPSPSPG